MNKTTESISLMETARPTMEKYKSYRAVKTVVANSTDDYQKVTDLIFAASRGDAKAVKKLVVIDKVNPDMGDYDQRTALHVAASDGKLSVVEVLLEQGAEINVVDRWSETPLDGAVKYGMVEVAAFLASKGGKTGDIKATTMRLINAVSDQDIETVKIILSIGHDPNGGDYDKRTPLHLAVAVGNLEIAKLLVEHGADIHAMDRFGGTPFSDAQAHAPRFGRDEMRDYLLENGGLDFKDVDDDNKVDIGYLLVGLQVILFILFGLFVRYDDGAAGLSPVDSAAEIQGVYPQFQDVHVMIFIGFGMLMLFLKKYAYSAISYNLLLSVIVIQWQILVSGFFVNAFHSEWVKIKLSLTSFLFADFSCATVLITFGACLGKVTKPSQLVVIALLEIIFFTINEEISKKLHVVDIGGSMIVHAFGAYFGLAVSYVLCTPEARTHPDNGANYTSDTLSMVGSLFLWIFWPSFNSALAGPYDQERTVINTILALTACGTASFAASYILRREKHFDMVDVQNATLAGGVAVGTCANMMLGPVGAQVIGFLAGWLSVTGYVIIQPALENKLGVYDTCGVHNLHGMPGVLAGVCSIVVVGIATVEDYNTEENFLAVFPEGADPGMQAAYLFCTLAMAIVTGLITGKASQFVCGSLQPRVYNDDKFFDKAFR